MSDIYECEHLEARDYFRTTTIGDKNVKLPGPSAHVSPTKWELKRPAPALNADAKEIDWNRRIKSEPLPLPYRQETMVARLAYF